MNDTQISITPYAGRVANDETRWHKVEFKGSGREWFGIWIINVCATVLTLGIYSAWAKVRFKKYFYQNTYVAGRNFDYHAKPLAILKARLVIVVVFAITIPLKIWIFPLLIFAALYPLALAWSARFNARNTSWGNARFNFDGGVAAAYGTYLVLPFLSIFTLYLAYPLVQRAMHHYVVTGHTLGGKRFWFDPKGWPYYRAYLGAIGIGFIATIAFSIIGGILSSLIDNPELVATLAGENPGLDPDVANVVLGAYFGAIIGFQLGYVALSAGLRNILFNQLQLVTGGEGEQAARTHRFRSTVKTWPLMVLVVSNLLLIVVSLGLLLPWTRIRYHRYLAANTLVLIDGDLAEVVSEAPGSDSALGDAYSDVEGLDMGLGF